jgi:hypothetical protein
MFFTNMGKNFKEFLEFSIKQSNSFFQEVEFAEVLKVFDLNLAK